MSEERLLLTSEQKASFDADGFLHLRGFYSAEEMEEMRRQFGALVTDTEGRPKNMSYAFMDSPEGYRPDPYNPKNVVGMMDQPLANDYWFDQFTEPRIVSAMCDLLGPNIDFHNGKVRNKPRASPVNRDGIRIGPTSVTRFRNWPRLSPISIRRTLRLGPPKRCPAVTCGANGQRKRAGIRSPMRIFPKESASSCVPNRAMC